MSKPLIGRFALPAALPANEHVLWQGAPNWRALARNALHVRGLTAYLGLIVAWVLLADFLRGDPAQAIAFDTARAALVASIPVALGLLYAWMCARASAYTITNRRVVLRMGLAVPLTLNLPFSKIDGADLSLKSDGTGDLALKLAPGSKGLGWFIMWPHTRPWGKGQPQPMLRALPDAMAAGEILAQALLATSNESVSLAQPTRIVDTEECHHGATTVAA